MPEAPQRKAASSANRISLPHGVRAVNDLALKPRKAQKHIPGQAAHAGQPAEGLYDKHEGRLGPI